MITIDHILFSSPDLDEGARLIEGLTGVRPAAGGSHPGFGTRNQLLSLGDDVYFEIISPDPAQSLDGNRGGRIAAQSGSGMLTFAVQCDDLPALRAAALKAGVEVDEPVAMTRTRPDGVVLSWSILNLRDSRFPDAVPFAIDWGRTEHPSGSTPKGCGLKSFVALHPDPAGLQGLYDALGIPVRVERASCAGFMAVLDTPCGDARLLPPGGAARR